jgi:hypothetical protein
MLLVLMCGLAAVQGMLLMDASEKMDSLNLLRCFPMCLSTFHTRKCICMLQRCPHKADKSCYNCRWMAPIASLCLIPAVLVLEPTVIRCIWLRFSCRDVRPLGSCTRVF